METNILWYFPTISRTCKIRNYGSDDPQFLWDFKKKESNLRHKIVIHAKVTRSLNRVIRGIQFNLPNRCSLKCIVVYYCPCEINIQYSISERSNRFYILQECRLAHRTYGILFILLIIKHLICAWCCTGM